MVQRLSQAFSFTQVTQGPEHSALARFSFNAAVNGGYGAGVNRKDLIGYVGPVLTLHGHICSGDFSLSGLGIVNYPNNGLG